MAKSLQSLTLLSGKGGSGKTILALSMSRVLAEAGCKVLLMDCDMSTHGATYFFEAELEAHNYISLTSLLNDDYHAEYLLKTKAGFWFIPSTLSPAQKDQNKGSEIPLIERAFATLANICEREGFDTVIFDCQAGYSQLADIAARRSRRNLIVLEPDAVSSAALRVLYLQIGNSLKPSNTWQIFNKLTQEERPIYERVSGGTLFPNLPPVPFDWQVRASFATCSIPSITTSRSAFGLGVLRIMRILFPDVAEMLTKLENDTVGGWYSDLSSKVEELRSQKFQILAVQSSRRRLKAIQNARVLLLITVTIAVPLLLLSLLSTVGVVSASRLIEFMASAIQNSVIAVLSLGILSVGIWRYFRSVVDVEAEYEQDRLQEKIASVQAEMDKYVTLLETDPSLVEYEKLRLHSMGT